MRDKMHIAALASVSGLTIVWIISAVAIWASRCSDLYLVDTPHLIICSEGVSASRLHKLLERL